MKTHRLAVVGCGALAQSMHLPHAQRNPRIELVATCDLVKETAEEAREKFGAQRAETDWRKLVNDPGIDLFVLATHHTLRAEFIVPALEAGKPVYTEKPLAPSLEEMIRIADARRKTGVSVCVGHNRRSSPAMLELKRFLDKALSGVEPAAPSLHRIVGRERLPEEEQLQVLMRINDDARSWKPWVFHDPVGIMFNEMVHFIDLALWFNPTPPVRVFADGSPRGNFTLVLHFQDGSMTTMQHSFVGHFDYPKELFEVSVNNVSIAMDQHFEVRQFGLEDEPPVQTFPFAHGVDWPSGPGLAGYMQSIEEERRRATKEGRPPRTLNVNKGHYQHLDRFLDHIEGKGENPCDVESAIAVNRIALKMLQSVRLGLPVVLGPEDWHLPAV